MEGEVSTQDRSLRHWYFPLKDDERRGKWAVVWKTATKLIRFRPKDGMQVVVRGGLRVYRCAASTSSVEVLEPLGRVRCSRPSRS